MVKAILIALFIVLAVASGAVLNQLVPRSTLICTQKCNFEIKDGETFLLESYENGEKTVSSTPETGSLTVSISASSDAYFKLQSRNGEVLEGSTYYSYTKESWLSTQGFVEVYGRTLAEGTVIREGHWKAISTKKVSVYVLLPANSRIVVHKDTAKYLLYAKIFQVLLALVPTTIVLFKK